jgi:hypothetical protein
VLLYVSGQLRLGEVFGPGVFEGVCSGGDTFGGGKVGFWMAV